MQRWIAVLLLTMVGALTASAAKKDAGTTTLKDVQPAGTTDTQGEKEPTVRFCFRGFGEPLHLPDQSENLRESE